MRTTHAKTYVDLFMHSKLLLEHLLDSRFLNHLLLTRSTFGSRCAIYAAGLPVTGCEAHER